jgi:hypothetical protein
MRREFLRFTRSMGVDLWQASALILGGVMTGLGLDRRFFSSSGPALTVVALRPHRA